MFFCLLVLFNKDESLLAQFLAERKRKSFSILSGRLCQQKHRQQKYHRVCSIYSIRTWHHFLFWEKKIKKLSPCVLSSLKTLYVVNCCKFCSFLLLLLMNRSPEVKNDLKNYIMMFIKNYAAECEFATIIFFVMLHYHLCNKHVWNCEFPKYIRELRLACYYILSSYNP